MKLTEVSTNSLVIFPFAAAAPPGRRGGRVLFCSLFWRTEVNWIAFVRRPCTTLTLFQACLRTHDTFRARSRACPSGPLQPTGESGWEVYEEVSATLQRSCCYCSQSGSRGSQISVKVFLHPHILSVALFHNCG